MRTVVLVFTLVSSGLLATFSEAVEPTDLHCFRAIQHEVRVRGCQQQPCTIRKGQRLPFEIDFTFTGPPLEADEFQSSVFVSYYAPPPGFYGSEFHKYWCRGERCGRTLYPNKKYTLRNSLYVDPKSRCTAGCDGMNEDGTGKRTTNWRYIISDSRSNITDGSDTGRCSFELEFNITN